MGTRGGLGNGLEVGTVYGTPGLKNELEAGAVYKILELVANVAKKPKTPTVEKPSPSL
jgi:hypothetical protein